MIIAMDYSIQHQDNLVMEIEAVSDTEIRGYKMTKYWAFDQGIYFYAKFSEPFTVEYVNDTPHLFQREALRDMQGQAEIPRHKARRTAPCQSRHIGGGPVTAHAPTWPRRCPDSISTAPAPRQGRSGTGGFRNRRPATADADDLTKFYTALYHTAIAPNLFTDADGRYLGMDRRPKQGSAEKPVYTIFSA